MLFEVVSEVIYDVNNILILQLSHPNSNELLKLNFSLFFRVYSEISFITAGILDFVLFSKCIQNKANRSRIDHFGSQS